MTGEKKSFPKHIEKEADTLLQARREKSKFWHYASMVGMGGWLFALPVVAGAYFGRYLDRRFAMDTSWTLTFIILGIAAGIYNLWEFLLKKGNS